MDKYKCITYIPPKMTEWTEFCKLMLTTVTLRIIVICFWIVSIEIENKRIWSKMYMGQNHTQYIKKIKINERYRYVRGWENETL